MLCFFPSLISFAGDSANMPNNRCSNCIAFNADCTHHNARVSRHRYNRHFRTWEITIYRDVLCPTVFPPRPRMGSPPVDLLLLCLGQRHLQLYTLSSSLSSRCHHLPTLVLTAPLLRSLNTYTNLSKKFLTSNKPIRTHHHLLGSRLWVLQASK